MTREDFINSKWISYPSWPPPMGQWQAGRVVELLSQGVTLLHNGSTVSIKVPSTYDTQDPSLGKSIPHNFLVRGDIVAVPTDHSAIYLLSPNLTPEPPDLEKEPWQDWRTFLDTVDSYFLSEQFQQARTPFLTKCPGVDHHIDFLKVEGAVSNEEWYLPTSPEIHLKKMLCRGHEKVYEIKTCFRDDFIGQNHQKEFTMVEWYRAYGSLEDLSEDIIMIIKKLGVKFPSLQWGEVKSQTMRELFAEYVDFNFILFESNSSCIILIRTSVPPLNV